MGHVHLPGELVVGHRQERLEERLPLRFVVWVLLGGHPPGDHVADQSAEGGHLTELLVDAMERGVQVDGLLGQVPEARHELLDVARGDGWEPNGVVRLLVPQRDVLVGVGAGGHEEGAGIGEEPLTPPKALESHLRTLSAASGSGGSSWGPRS